MKTPTRAAAYLRWCLADLFAGPAKAEPEPSAGALAQSADMADMSDTSGTPDTSDLPATPDPAPPLPAGDVAPKRRHGVAKAAVILLYAAVVLPYLRSGIPIAYSYERYLLYNYVLLCFVPLLMIMLAFGERVEEYAFDKGDGRAALRLFVLFFTPMLVVLAVASRWPAFQQYYPIYSGARFGGRELLFWEVAYNGVYMFCWEFFFRGFLLFGLRPGLGKWSLHVQAIAFGIMHWGKPMPEFYASFLTGYVLGFVSLRCRSFLPTFGLHAACATSFDLLVLAWGGRLAALLRW